MSLIPRLGRSPGEGNGNPLQYSYLENSLGRADWQGTIHGAVKSWTWLSDTHTHTHTHTRAHPNWEAQINMWNILCSLTLIWIYAFYPENVKQAGVSQLFKSPLNKQNCGTSLVVQWLRFHAPLILVQIQWPRSHIPHGTSKERRIVFLKQKGIYWQEKTDLELITHGSNASLLSW